MSSQGCHAEHTSVAVVNINDYTCNTASFHRPQSGLACAFFPLHFSLLLAGPPTWLRGRTSLSPLSCFKTIIRMGEWVQESEQVAFTHAISGIAFRHVTASTMSTVVWMFPRRNLVRIDTTLSVNVQQVPRGGICKYTTKKNLPPSYQL